MTENFAERFVEHRNVSLAPQAVSELPFHHGECGLYVTALMVMLQKLIAPELEVVVHLLPRSPAITAMMRRERDERRGSYGSDRFRVRSTRVPLICGNFGNLKVLCRAINQSRKHNGSFLWRPWISTAVTMLVFVPTIR